MASGNDVYITKNGRETIEMELNNLVRVERESLKKAIAEARALGDLSENAEYHSAKEKQSLLEGKIMQLQGVIAKAKVVDVSAINSDKIVFGATVTLYDDEKDRKITYQIVGDDESNINKGKVSYKSPLGRAMIGKEEGDEVVVKAPKGDIVYEVESFEYI